MGSTFSEINQNVQQSALNCKKMEEVLKMYTFICQTYDESLGRLYIYRKKQYNFDYIAMTDKLVERDYIDQSRKIVKINEMLKSQNNKLCTDALYLKFRNTVILKDASLWLKIFSYQTLEEGNNQNFKRIIVCYEYFNFTLKDYLKKMNFRQKEQRHKIPSQMAYILGSILDAYNQLRYLKIQHPHISIIPLLSSITTPSFIYIDIQGCLKFLPIPLFMMGDYTSNVDQCLVRCCSFEGDGQRMNVVIPKYGIRSMRKKDEGLEKIDKIFMDRLKKLIKYMKKQIQFGNSFINERKGESQLVGTNLSQNPINLHHPNLNSIRVNTERVEVEYWETLQNCINLEQMIQKVSSAEQIQNRLEIKKIKNISTLANEPVSLAPYSLNKQESRKKENFDVQSRMKSNNSQLMMNLTNNSTLTRSNAMTNKNDKIQNSGHLNHIVSNKIPNQHYISTTHHYYL